MIKVVAISHAYTEPFTRVGLLDGTYKDIDLTVIVPRDAAFKDPAGYNRLIVEGYKVIKLRTILNFHHSIRKYLWGLVKALWQIRPDIIFINNEPWSSTAVQAVILKKLLGLRSKIIIYTCENLSRHYPFPFGLLEKIVLNNVDLILTITKNEGEKILRAKGYKGKTAYLPLAVDTNAFQKMDVSAFKSSLIKEKNAFVIGYSGRLVPEKGMVVLIDTLKMLGPDFRLLIVGDGPQKNSLAEAVGEKGLEGRVIFTGRVFIDELPKFLNCMDVLVLPSLTTKNWKEQFGRVLIEAMACGVPVIGSSSGEIPVVLGAAGYVFKEGDVGSLKESLERIKADPSLRNGLGAKGRQRVLENFDKKIVMDKTLAIYKGFTGK